MHPKPRPSKAGAAVVEGRGFRVRENAGSPHGNEGARMTLDKIQLDAIKKTGLAMVAFFKGAIFVAMAVTACAISFSNQNTTFGEFVEVLQLPSVRALVVYGGVYAALFRFFYSPPVMLTDWLEKIRSQRLAR
jgi:hypothetical protein